MALPFIAGVIVGAVGVVAYKNRDSLKEKSKVLFEQIKEKSETLKKDVENKISQVKDKIEEKEEKVQKEVTRRTRKPSVVKKVKPAKNLEANE